MYKLMLNGAPTRDSKVRYGAVRAFMRVSAQYLGVNHAAESLSADSRCVLAAWSTAGQGLMKFDHQASLQKTENRS